MITLAHALTQLPTDRPLWHGRDGWVGAGVVRARAAALAAQLPSPRVALAFRHDESLALAILAAERRGATMLLVPSAWDQPRLEVYLARAGIDTLVTDRPELSARTMLRPTDTSPAINPDTVQGCAETARWIIPTSGTTGEPKLVEHTLASLARTVRTDSVKGAAYTWGFVYELARFAGLQVFLQALLGGSRLAWADRSAPLETLVDSLAAAGCNALSATPTFWRRLVTTVASDRLALSLVTLGGEIADDLILRALAAKFPSAKRIHIYASTEAGVGFSVADGRPGFPAAFLTTTPTGIALRVDDEDLLWVRPSTAVARFVGTGASVAAADGWINTGDRVRVSGDRVFFLGRANGAINVGGNKVFPEEVEDCIRAVAGVQYVLVQARANALIGAVVEARVISAPSADRATLKRAILTSCRSTLAPYQVPALITWVDDLAVSSAGKILRT